VSESGVLAVLRSPVEIWVVGELSIEVGRYLLLFKPSVGRDVGRLRSRERSSGATFVRWLN